MYHCFEKELGDASLVGVLKTQTSKLQTSDLETQYLSLGKATKMASAVPDQNETLRFFLVDQRLLTEKIFFDLFSIFSKSIIKEKSGIIWKNEHNFAKKRAVLLA